MNKLIAKINKVAQELIDNYKTKQDFKRGGGIKVVITEQNIDKVYDKREYESISRYGPYMLPVRGIKEAVYNWCLKAKGTIRVPDEFRYDFGSETFYFSRAKDADEFKKLFNLA